jgi:hypothetical protein
VTPQTYSRFAVQTPVNSNRRFRVLHLSALRRGVLGATLAVLAISLAGSPSAQASEPKTPGPGWETTARTFPTTLAPNSTGTLEIDIVDVGAERTRGPITVVDHLPPGVAAVDAGELEKVGENGEPTLEHALWTCTGNGPGAPPSLIEATVVTCTNETSGFEFAGGGGGPSPGLVNAPSEGPNRQPEIGIAVKAGSQLVSRSEAEATPNAVTVEGGHAAGPASTVDPVPVGASDGKFDITGWDGWLSNPNGTVDTVAGSHPYEAAFSFDIATELRHGVLVSSGGELRNVEVALPAGLIGNPSVVGQCTRAQLNGKACPPASEVGIVSLSLTSGVNQTRELLYNMVPPPGVPAELGLSLEGISSYLNASVRTAGDFGIDVRAGNAPQRGFVRVVTTLWGTPADGSHLIWRRPTLGGCTNEQIGETEREFERFCKPTGTAPRPFLTLPPSCSAPLEYTLRVNSWEHPGEWAERTFTQHAADGKPAALGSCELLGLEPVLNIAPEKSAADSPTGLTADVTMPVDGLENNKRPISSDIKAATVTLPEGMVVNPGQAAGLVACALGTGGNEGEADIGVEATARCPQASKLGTIRAQSPLLKQDPEPELTGNVYLLQSNPPDVKLLAVPAGDGVEVKLVLDAHLNGQTGQITATVSTGIPGQGLPELPVSDFHLEFTGGARAALVTPATCGTYTSSGVFTPSASPFAGNALSASAFGVVAPAEVGGSCNSPLPFSPSLTAGSESGQAGAFTNLSVTVQRGDGQQRVETVNVTTPPGVSALISQVPLCSDTQANAGTCGASSHIGHAAVASGPGSNPFVIPEAGGPEAAIYLTGPYKGAPFGLSIVTPVIAGPFNLGTIVTRAALSVDRTTGQATVKTDPLPQIIDGVPTDLRIIKAVIDRRKFLFNGTSCTAETFTGTAVSTGGTGVPLSSPFGLAGCKNLQYEPTLETTTGAHASRANGTSLFFKISYPKDALGSQAWFRDAKFVLPAQLPARQTTLKGACLAKVFEASPAGCPSHSRIGHAIVHTQVLSVPLTGSVYLVSFGNAKFPDVVIVLEGEGVTIELRGETLIRKGITSATFRNTPDVPFESIEVVLPAGPFSEFGAYLPAKDHESPCGVKLVMPTSLVAQNGREIRKNQTIKVVGCHKAKKKRGKKARHSMADARR